MNNAQRFIAKLKSFSSWSIGGSQTQVSSVYTRDKKGRWSMKPMKYCEKCSLFYRISATVMAQKKA